MTPVGASLDAKVTCRELQKRGEFYRADVEALMKAERKKRLLRTDDRRRLLAAKGKTLDEITPSEHSPIC